MSWILFTTSRPTYKLEVGERYCKGCNLCVWLCPPQALRLSEEFTSEGYHAPVLAGTCTGCRVCEVICPDFAIFIKESA